MANKIIVQQLRSNKIYNTGNAKLPKSTDFNENEQYKYGTLALNYHKEQESITTINDENQVIAFNYNLNLTSDSSDIEEQVYEIIKTAKGITINNEWIITHRIINEGIITLLGGCFNNNKIEYIKVIITADKKYTKEISEIEFNAENISYKENINVKAALDELFQEIDNINSNKLTINKGEGINIEDEGNNKTISVNLSFDTSKITNEETGKVDEYLLLIDSSTRRAIAQIDISSFLIDGMLDDVVYDSDNKTLKFTWKDVKDKETGENKQISVNVADLVDTYTASENEGLKLEDNQFSVKLKENDNFIGFDENGNIVTKNILSQTDIEQKITDKINDLDSEVSNNINSEIVKVTVKQVDGKLYGVSAVISDALKNTDGHTHTNKSELDKIKIGDATQFSVNNKNFTEVKDENENTVGYSVEVSSDNISVNNTEDKLSNINGNNVQEVLENINEKFEEQTTHFNNHINNKEVHVTKEKQDSWDNSLINYARNTSEEFIFDAVLNGGVNETKPISNYIVKGLDYNSTITVSFHYEVYNAVFKPYDENTPYDERSRISIQFNDKYYYWNIIENVILENGEGDSVKTVTLNIPDYAANNGYEIFTFLTESNPIIRFDYVTFDEGGYIKITNFTVNVGEIENPQWKPSIFDTINVDRITAIAAHSNDNSLHITQNERESWNKAKTDIDAFLTDATTTQDAVDTLKEIQKFIEDDTTASSTLINKVNNLETTVDECNNLISQTKDSIGLDDSGKFIFNDQETTVLNGLNDVKNDLNSESTRAIQKENELETAIDTINQNTTTLEEVVANTFVTYKNSIGLDDSGKFIFNDQETTVKNEINNLAKSITDNEQLLSNRINEETSTIKQYSNETFATKVELSNIQQNLQSEITRATEKENELEASINNLNEELIKDEKVITAAFEDVYYNKPINYAINTSVPYEGRCKKDAFDNYAVSQFTSNTYYGAKGLKGGDTITVTFDIEIDNTEWLDRTVDYDDVTGQHQTGIISLQMGPRWGYMSLSNVRFTESGKYHVSSILQIPLKDYTKSTPVTEDIIGDVYVRYSYVKPIDESKPMIKITNFRINKGSKDMGWTPSVFDSEYNLGCNNITLTTSQKLPINKRLCNVVLSGTSVTKNITFGMYCDAIVDETTLLHAVNGQENHYIIYNSMSTDVTLTLPNTSNIVLLSGSSLTISPNSYAELNCIIVDDGVKTNLENQGRMYIRAIV